MHVLTANRLIEGDVVYWDGAGWQTTLDDAQIAEDAEAAASLEACGRGAVEANLVVEPYVIEIVREGDQLVPAHHRERIRQGGPTVTFAQKVQGSAG